MSGALSILASVPWTTDLAWKDVFDDYFLPVNLLINEKQ